MELTRRWGCPNFAQRPASCRHQCLRTHEVQPLLCNHPLRRSRRQLSLATRQMELQSSRLPWRPHKFDIYPRPSTSQLHTQHMLDLICHLCKSPELPLDNVCWGIWRPLWALTTNWSSLAWLLAPSGGYFYHSSGPPLYYHLGMRVPLCIPHIASRLQERYQWFQQGKRTLRDAWLSKGWWWFRLGISCTSLLQHRFGSSLLDMAHNHPWRPLLWKSLQDKDCSLLRQQLAVPNLQNIPRKHGWYPRYLWEAWNRYRVGMLYSCWLMPGLEEKCQW